MNRITCQRTAEVIAAGLDLIPESLKQRVQPHWLTEDPVAVGFAEPGFVDFADGRRFSWSEIAHCAYPWNQPLLPKARQHTTIVLPPGFAESYRSTLVDTVLHEFGHALHELARWVAVEGITAYGQTNHYEGFAEAFRLWIRPTRLRPGPIGRSVFERLAA